MTFDWKLYPLQRRTVSMSHIIASHDIEAADSALVGDLTAEVERLRAHVSEMQPLLGKQQDQVAKLEAENAELRANFDTSPCAGCIAVANQNEALKAEAERLRAAERASVLQHQKDWDRLEAENERLRSGVQQIEANEIAHAEANEVIVTKVARLEAENAELRAKPRPSQRAVDMLATAQVAADRERLFHDNSVLKARLAAVGAVATAYADSCDCQGADMTCMYCDLEEALSEHPKPEGA